MYGYRVTILKDTEKCEHLLSKLRVKPKYVIGKKKCPTTGQTYYECYYETMGRSNPREQIKQFSGCHRIERATGDRDSNVENCCKDNEFEIHGLKRKELLLCTKNTTIDTLLPWQADVINKLKEQSTRQILWIYDEEGRKGKTSLAVYIWQQYRNAVYKTTSNGLYSIKKDTAVVVIDFCRSQDPKKINYGLIESIKDGIFKPQWKSTSLIMDYKPYIVCFASFKPIMKRLSMDRWVLFEIKD